MESQYKAKLKSIILDLRHILEGYYDAGGGWHPGDMEERLAALGVRRDREPLPPEQLSHLSEEDRRARLIVDAFIQSAPLSGRSREESVGQFLQEASYTWANRLIALRCMEARGLIDEIIIQKESYGGRSLKHHRLTRQNPEVCAGEDDGLYAALFAEFALRAEELPLLFHPDEPVIALTPGVAALKKCIRLLSTDDEIFTAPDALGWAYQYWNTEEKDRVFEKVRTVKGAKIEKSDIIPVTQLYTEPYMVKFLVQNSLGALWSAMHPASRLSESWEYYVRDADREHVAAKPLKQLSFLDPSVGSGHFLLEAFDLLYAMYMEEGELKTPGEICEAILSQNLFGIDIDERAIQIAACALYMKAKEKDPSFRPTRINLTAANIHVGADKDHLAAFLEKHPEDKQFQTSLQLIFESLRHADELGTLLQIEEPVEKEFRFLKVLDDEEKAGPPKQKALFAEMEKPEQAPLPIGVPSYEEWKAGLLDRLSEHFREEFASTDFSSRFFGETAGKGLSLFDFLSRRYDVVATNPPYMGSKNMGSVVKRYIEDNFPSGKFDLYAAFIIRCLQLSKSQTGRVAMVTQQSWMFLRSFADLRAIEEEKLKKTARFKGILRETSIETLAHLGPRAFREISGEVVNTVLFTIAKKPPKIDQCMTAFRLVGPKSPEEKDRILTQTLLNKNPQIMSKSRQNTFLSISTTPLIYWLSPYMLELFTISEKIVDRYEIREGPCTGNDLRWLRFFWEINDYFEWRSFPKGGGYQKWSGLDFYTIRWGKDGTAIKGYPGSIIPNESWYFKNGLTYTEAARGALGVRYLSSSRIPGNKAPGLFPSCESIELSSAILNCRVISFLARTVASTIDFGIGPLRMVPIPNISDEFCEKLEKLSSYCMKIKSKLVSEVPWERSYDLENQLISIKESTFPHANNRTLYHPLTAILHSYEALTEKIIFDSYELDTTDVSSVIQATGSPAGWFPLIPGYDSLPSLPEGLSENSLNILDFLKSHDYRTFSHDDLILLKRRLRNLFEAGPGAKEEVDDVENDASEDDEEENGQVAVGTRIPIPAETFLEELSQKLEIHPISIYWLLDEGIEQEGWRCLPEEQRLTKDRFTVLILRLLGHRWPKQVEAGESLPEWADDDGIIPMMEGTEESTLYQHLRARIAADYGDDQVSAQENVFAEVMGKPLQEWVKKDFFRHHISQFKKRPIAWHLSSAKWASRPRQDAAFESLVYYHKTDGDLLPKLKNQYVIPLIKRLETELRGLESANGSLTGEQEARKSLLTERIQELKAFDAVLTGVGAHGFGPEPLQPQLRQYAINDAMLCLKVQWLKKLSSVIKDEPLPKWKRQADETGLHADFSSWIDDAMTHLACYCATVGPNPPAQNSFYDDPTAVELAGMICAGAREMFLAVRELACGVWWKSFDAAVLKPVSQQIADAKKEQKALKERLLDSKLDAAECSAIKQNISGLKSKVRACQEEWAAKFGQGHKLREAINAWPCPEDLISEVWLSRQAMFDEISSLNGKRLPPTTVAQFIRQEGLYQPDINDGVRVNIAPLQQAGLLTADVLAGKDVEKAISDRAAWRDDERRWCREEKLPKPGWWE